MHLTPHLVHGPGGVIVHPLRDLDKWYHYVQGTILIKNQDVNTRYFGTDPPVILDSFQNGRHENIKSPNSIWSYLSLLLSNMQYFLEINLNILRTWNSLLAFNAKPQGY